MCVTEENRWKPTVVQIRMNLSLLLWWNTIRRLQGAALFSVAEEYVPNMPQTVPYRPQVRPAASAVGT